jgi:fatty acid desaturase
MDHAWQIVEAQGFQWPKLKVKGLKWPLVKPRGTLEFIFTPLKTSISVRASVNSVFLVISRTKSFNLFASREQSLLSLLSLLCVCVCVCVCVIEKFWIVILVLIFLWCNPVSFFVGVVWFDHRFCLLLKLNLKWDFDFDYHENKEKL